MRIGIYVGSFNPIHKGHIKIVNYLIENNYVDKVIIIPTGNYWDKKSLIDVDDRINMAKLYENKNIIVNGTLNSLPYTWEILDELKKTYATDELNLIIGDDNLEKFHLWKNVSLILENKVLVIPRGNIDFNKYINQFAERDKFIVIDNFPIENISSTMIRELIENNKLDDVLLYIDKEVLNYILTNNLYNNVRFPSKKLDLKK